MDAVPMRDAVLMANVARRYYLRSQSKQEIADTLGISRFKVARLLTAALETGIVRIQVGLPGESDGALSEELRRTFSLDRVVVLEDIEESPRALLRRLGQAALEVLGEILTKDDVLGLASARPLLAMGDDVTAFPACPVVQLTGAVSRPDARDIIQTIRALTEVGGGEAHVFYAPIIGSEPTTGMRRQPDVRQAFALLPDVSVAVLGIGSWEPGLSTVHDAIDEDQRRALTEAGVTAEIAGIYLDDAGAPVANVLTGRTLTPSLPELLRIPARFGVTFDARKARAVRTAIRGKLINNLITHRALAEEMLTFADA
ncbi:sugar-binding transcriptional regulator [Pseudonocardia sp. DLS-67]